MLSDVLWESGTLEAVHPWLGGRLLVNLLDRQPVLAGWLLRRFEDVDLWSTDKRC